jgi:hypothetical protein
MSDSSMKDVTGQAGVSIGIDDIVIYQSIGETRYTDTDGWGTASEGAGGPGTAGSVVISDKEVLKQFNAILDDSKYGFNSTLTNGRTFGSYGAGIVSNATVIADVDGDLTTTADQTLAQVVNPFDGTTASQVAGVSNTTGISPLTIDIGECTALTTGFSWNNAGTALSGTTIAGVIIGLPTIEIVTSGDTYTVGVEMTGSVNGDASISPTGHVAEFIQISKSDATMAVLGGRVEIAAH